MKRDWDLIREIFAALEARDTTRGGLAPDAFPNHGKDLVAPHFSPLPGSDLGNRLIVRN